MTSELCLFALLLPFYMKSNQYAVCEVMRHTFPYILYISLHATINYISSVYLLLAHYHVELTEVEQTFNCLLLP